MSDTSESTLIASLPVSPDPRELSGPLPSKVDSTTLLSSGSRSPATSMISSASILRIKPCPWLKAPTLADLVYLHYALGHLAINSRSGPAREHALSVTRSPPGYVPAGQSFALAPTIDLSAITRNLAGLQRQNVPAYWQHRREAALSVQQCIDVTAAGKVLIRQAEIYRVFTSRFLHLCMVRRVCNQDTSAAVRVWDGLSSVASWSPVWKNLLGFDSFGIAVTGMGIPPDWLGGLERIVSEVKGLRFPEPKEPTAHWELHCPWPVPVGCQGGAGEWDRYDVERATWIVVKRLHEDGWGYREILEFTDIELEGLGIGPKWKEYFRKCVDDLRRGRINLVVPPNRVPKDT